MRRSRFCSLAAGLPLAVATRVGAAGGKLRMGVIPIDADAEPYYAAQTGAFKRRGLDIELTTINSGSAILAAVAGGSIDLGSAAAVSLVAAYRRGIGVTCVAPTSYYSSKAPSTVLMVMQDSPVRTARDLAGKIVGVNVLKDLTQLSTMAWVDKNGGDSSSMKFVELGFPNAFAALSQRRVDAAVIADPFITGALKTARIVGQPYDAVALEFPVGCFFVKDDFARDNGASIRPIVDALREAGLWANANPRASAEILAVASGLDVAVIESTKRVVYPRRALVPADVQPLIEVAARYGVIPSSFPAQEVIWKG